MDVARANVPAFDADPAVREQVLERFWRKYLKAVLAARNPSSEERAWEAFYFWLVFPATSRKPFEVPEREAKAFIAALRLLVREARPTALNE